MARYATLLVETKGNRKECRDEIEQLKKQFKSIVAIREADPDPSVRKVMLELGDSRKGKADVMIEVKISSESDLESLENLLRAMVKDVVVLRAY